MNIQQKMHLLLRARARFGISCRKGLLLSFLLGFAVRLIPEILAYPYPIGFDTVHYAAMTKNGVVLYHWTSVFSTWLFYATLKWLYSFSQVDPFLLLKIMGPLLYALSASGIYFFSKRALNWDGQKSVIAAFFFVFQLAAFRISWDLLRNTLGMAILLFAVPFIRSLKTKKDFLMFVLLSTLVVFSHELASVIMFTVVIFGIVLNDLSKGNKKRFWKVLAAVFLALAIFLTTIFLRIFPLRFAAQTNVVWTVQPPARPAGLFFLADYFVGSRSGHYASYFDLASQVCSVFIVLYLLCLPLVFVGFFRNRVLDVWALFLVCASFSSLVTPYFALDYWDRWMFLLVYPFTFYAVNGMSKICRSVNGAVRPSLGLLNWMKVSKLMTAGILCCIVLQTSFYIGALSQSDNYFIFSIPTISRYFSVAPTVPVQDVSGTVKVMEWLNENMDNGSCVLVHSAFLWWARLYLVKDQTIVAYSSDITRAFNVARDRGFYPVYLVWWGENIGWYWITVPTYFSSVFESGRIAVFEY